MSAAVRILFLLVVLAVPASLTRGFAAGSTAAPAKRSYNIRLATIHAYATRSRRNDPVYAQISVYVNGQLQGSVAWNGICDDKACPNRAIKVGSFNLGLATSVDTGPVGDRDDVKWTYEVVAAVHAPAAEQYDSAASALAASTCADAWPCAASAGTTIFTGWTFAVCEGPLAVDSVTRTGAFIASHVSNGEWGYDRRYAGLDAPSGCSKSDYQIVTIVRQTT